MLKLKPRNCLVLWTFIWCLGGNVPKLCSATLGATDSAELDVAFVNVTQEIPNVASSEALDTNNPHTETEQNMLTELSKQIQELRTNLQNLETRFENEIISKNEIREPKRISDSDMFLQSSACGEVVVGNRGQINFIHNRNSSTQSFPLNCIWTIRTGRELIKVTTDSQLISTLPLDKKVYILEPVQGVSELKSTRLKALQNEVFKGPFLFVWLSMADATPGAFTFQFQLEFEGLGRTSPDYESSHFTHKFLEYSPEQEFNSLGWEDASLNNNHKFSKEILTLTSNFSTNTFIHINTKTLSCSSDEKIILFTNLNQETGQILGTNCCESDCESIMTTPQIPLVAIISKSYGKSMHFNMSMMAETMHESSYIYQENADCGGVLSGMNGVIDYKSAQQYNNNERCIWTIIPGPSPVKSVVIKLTHSGLEPIYDKLYTMELNDSNGRSLDDGLKITELTELAQTNVSYSVTGNQFYIVFYSDLSTTGSGFRLEYEAEKALSLNTSSENIYHSYDVQTTVNGSISLNMANWQRQLQAIAVTPKLDDNDSLLQLHFVPKQSYCDVSSSISVLLTHKGVFYKPSEDLNCFPVSLDVKEAMALVIIDNGNISSIPDFIPKINWDVTDTKQTNVSFVKTDGKTCGGVIEADSGVIQYKMDVNLDYEEECIWTIITEKAETEVTLIKHGFGNDGSLELLAVDPYHGTLSGLSLSQSSPLGLVNSSAALLVFKSVNANNQTGFVVEFKSTGTSNKTSNFVSTHNTDSNGKYSSSWRPMGNSTQDSAKTIHIFTQTSNVSDSVVISDFQYGLFRKETDCEYETITIYDVLSTGVSQLTQLPRSSEKADCLDLVAVAKIRPWFTTRSGSFIVVHKTISPVPITSFEWKQKIKEVKDVFTTSCGGMVNGRSGIIAYKESEIYLNKESCNWSVRRPRGTISTTFTLEREGFENCCDYITVTDMNGRATKLGHRSDSESMISTVVVQGSQAQVRFSSDRSRTGSGFRLTFR